MEKSKIIAVFIAIALGVLFAVGSYVYENRAALYHNSLVYMCRHVYKTHCYKYFADENDFVNCCAGIKKECVFIPAYCQKLGRNDV